MSAVGRDGGDGLHATWRHGGPWPSGDRGGGYAISGVAKDSPAANGGLQGGDVIVRLGESAITGLDDFDSALRKHKGGERVPVVVRRGGADVTLEVLLGQPK